MAAYREACEADPHDAAAHVNLGYSLLELQQPHAARQALQRAVALDADSADAQFLLARTHVALGQPECSLAAFEQVLRIQPGFQLARLELAQVLMRLGRGGDALRHVDRVLDDAPGDLDALHGKAAVLLQLGRHEEALAIGSEVLRHQPDFAEALANCGAACEHLGRLEDALAYHHRALALRPADADTCFNLATTLLQMGRCEQVLEVCSDGLRAHPEDPNLHWVRAIAHLTLGQFAPGWPEHEWRWRAKALDRRDERPDSARQWSGEPLAGKTLYVFGEQGLGDTIQMLRYLPLLAARGARVLLDVPPTIAPLLPKGSAATVLSPGTPLPPFDLHCATMSLPCAFGTDENSIPANVPYLAVDGGRKARWTARLPASAGPFIGLVWSGNPAHRNDANRSLALSMLASFVPPHCRLVSLQKEVRPGDLEALERYEIFHAGGELATFADTAALIDCMDLVISVDTSVAHLAGALAKPLWLLLPFAPDWRWMRDRDDSPWYPSARLFRQGEDRDWKSVLARVQAELMERFPSPR